ncbi:hypothetical protein A2533_03105 [Candidatus Falkowbacteria bacterium RIFOXYD2_FULL_35_9]|uniref:Guanylate cyclase domain-containing protein n=1 Tax=Candidatus Falkowbacteria bacterium RIFOXYC2_FULL_36_12 TaxID=1798002 RepID=A0A1F5SVX3_9BACT|nr:MAG: hypothetical protein A2478_00350 [Candidatus Falkowbacteria bacterium RIFOXYC2_FULL_36_12]OGF33590.1 MAG: hypothetical protein A2223_03485 [Candidatus Falkowbacteria bacterium RIFOXYA2_FULL_35_8]OGF46961.1 MAG: hypothetical protein A2533_03105 [Candidatus Falkowbacteria bacterium RIFOXYD2_FULL_35_9]
MTSEVKNVCCRNITIIARYVQKMLGSDSLLFQGLKYKEVFYKDENNWITLAEYNEVMEKAIDMVKDPKAPYKMGFSARELESWGAFKYIVNVFASVILGPIEVYKQVGRYNQFFNKTKTMVVAKEEKNSCAIKVKFAEGVNPVDDFYSDYFIQGILSSVPHIWNLPHPEFEEPLLEYNLKKLLFEIGKIDPKEVVIRNKKLFIKGEECGRPVVLISENVRAGKMFFGKYRSIQSEDDLKNEQIGLLISRDYTINKFLTLKKGQIFNAPYFIYKVKWQSISFWSKLYRLFIQSYFSKKSFREGFESQLATIKNYVETLEDKVIERTEQLNQAKKEAEFWRGKAENLLYAMLPEHIVKRMIVGKLKAEKTKGTIVFTDLAGFTNFSRDKDPEEVSNLLTKYFTEMSQIIGDHGGWVNKFLGDGILAMFGLHGNEDYPEQAIKAAIRMQRVMHKYPWGKRIGVATGKFITGEFGTEDSRRFDCLGHVVNLASRLQGHAESGEVLICSDTYTLVKDKFKFDEVIKISPKGIGEIDVHRIKDIYQEID